MSELSFGVEGESETERERENSREKRAGEGNFKQFLPRNEVIALLAVERDVGTAAATTMTTTATTTTTTTTTKTAESAKMTAPLGGSGRETH